MTEYCGQMHASDLLTAVQKQFPELTSSVLSRVMKFTFPKCPKMLNKLGTFYTGLVRRPEVGRMTRIVNKILCTEERLMSSVSLPDILVIEDYSWDEPSITASRMLIMARSI